MVGVEREICLLDFPRDLDNERSALYRVTLVSKNEANIYIYILYTLYIDFEVTTNLLCRIYVYSL